MDTININSSDPKFVSQSLAKLLNIPHLELTNLISKLTSLNPKQIVNLQDLAEKVKNVPPIADEVLQNIEHLVHNLIFKQFSNPVLDPPKEIISNALDAQARAQKENAPIEITLNEDRIKVRDLGDGISSGSLINYLVPGQTSNISQYLIKPEDHKANVTGRFGQGGISILYYLLYSCFPESSELPEIITNDNKSMLKVIYFHNNEIYEATFTYTGRCCINNHRATEISEGV